jgi:hypothetical protein
MTINYVTQSIRPVDDGSPPSTPGFASISAAPLHPGYIAGKTYTMLDAGTVSNLAVGAIDTVYLYPFRVFAPITFTAGAIRISAGGVGSSVKSGIWAHSYVSGRPLGAPLVYDNTGAATTGTGQIAIALAGSLLPGFYWFGTKFTGTLPTAQSIVTPTYLVPNGGAGSTVGLSASDTYSNNISALSFSEGYASFTVVPSAPVLQLAT